jgi:Trk-type K+ transport system membrane component
MAFSTAYPVLQTGVLTCSAAALQNFKQDYIVHGVIGFLLIAGAIGFPVCWRPAQISFPGAGTEGSAFPLIPK